MVAQCIGSNSDKRSEGNSIAKGNKEKTGCLRIKSLINHPKLFTTDK